MSRSGYDDECDNWQLVMYRGAVNSALRGQRGQRFLRELVEALEALPERRLVEGDFEVEGSYCALGALGQRRGLDLSDLDPEDARSVAERFDIAESLAREVVYINDEKLLWPRGNEGQERRWEIVHSWAKSHIKPEEKHDGKT